MAGRDNPGGPGDVGDAGKAPGADEDDSDPLGLTSERLDGYENTARNWLANTEVMQEWLCRKILVNIQIRQALVENPESKSNAALRAMSDVMEEGSAMLAMLESGNQSDKGLTKPSKGKK